MAAALVTVLLIMLVAGEYIDEIDGLLRAGRDRIEKQSRDDYTHQREAADMREYRLPFYSRRSEYLKFPNRVWVCLGEREVVTRRNDRRVAYISFIE